MHVEPWKFASPETMIEGEVDRAVPCSMLILRSRRLPNF